MAGGKNLLVDLWMWTAESHGLLGGYGLMEINPVRRLKTQIRPAAEAPPGEASSESASPVLPETAPRTHMKAVIELLLGNGFKASPENIKLAATLMEGQLPINRENLQKLNRSLKLLDIDVGGSTDEAMFFLKNDIPPTARNAEILKNYINGETKLAAQVESLMEAIEELPQGGLKERVLEALNGGGKAISREIASGQEGVSVEKAPAPVDGKALGKAMENTPPQREDPVNDEASKAVGARHKVSEMVREAPKAQGEPREVPPGADSRPANLKTEDSKAADVKAAEPKAADARAMDPKAAELKTTEPRTLDARPAELRHMDSEPMDSKAAASKPAGVKEPDTIWTKELNEGNNRELRRLDYGRELPEKPVVKLREAQENEPLAVQVRRKLSFELKDSGVRDVDEFLNRLRDGVEAARSELAKSEAPGTERLRRELTNIKDSLEFVNHIKENIYLQLPITVNNHETNGEILVFKDRNARKRNKGGTVSALIALDTMSLGRFETYVQKEGRKVHCQFRLRDEAVERLTKANLTKLRDMLREQGYELTGVEYRKAQESFTLLSKENRESPPKPGPMAFDIRM